MALATRTGSTMQRQKALANAEQIIQRHLTSFIAVGIELTRIQQHKLHKEAGFDTFKDYCQKRWEMGETRVYELIGAADVCDHLSAIAEVLPENEAQARPLTRLEPERRVVVWREVLAAVDDGQKLTAKLVAKIAGISGGTREALHSSESSEWYTPIFYTNAARDVMGGIDLDPASCLKANELVGAKEIYTEEDDGLSERWTGRVFLNPPFGRREEANESSMGVWSGRLLDEYGAGHVDQAVLVCNATPDRQWFWPLWKYAICFAYRRVHFHCPEDRPSSQPTHAHAFVYLGSNTKRFVEKFKEIGHVVIPKGGVSVSA